MVAVFQIAAEKKSIRSAPKIGEPPTITERINLNVSDNSAKNSSTAQIAAFLLAMAERGDSNPR
jgi:hypothetical protein